MAAFFYEATVESVLTNKTTVLRPGTVWMNVGNITSLEYYDADSTKVYLQTKDGGLRLQPPTPLLVSASQTTIATAMEAAASSDNEFRTFYVTKRDRTHATMTLAVKDIAYIMNYPAIDGVQLIRYVSGGTKPMWLLVEMSDEAVPEVFDSSYSGTGTNGTTFDEDSESF